MNFREGWRGRLWQGRFGSFVMDEQYLPAAARYVERSPVKAKLVKRAEDWPWSSAASHVDRRRRDVLAEGDWLREMASGLVCTWRQHLAEGDDAEFVSTFRRHENTGRPLGEQPLVERVGAMLSRDLTPKRPGPKPKREN